MKNNLKNIEVPDQILGIKLSENSIQKLKEGKETDLIKGFRHQNGNLFNAHLSLNEESKLVFRIITQENNITLSETDRIRTQISIGEIAKNFGFFSEKSILPEEANVIDYLLLENELGHRIIIHKDSITNQHLFFGLDGSLPSGNIYDFLRFYSDLDSKKIKEFLQITLKTQKESQIHFLPSIHDLETAVRTVFQVESLSDKSFLLENGIRDSTLDHAFFRGKFLKNIESLPLKKNSFYFSVPLYSFGHLNGFSNLEGPNIDGTQTRFSGELHKGIWFSNIINPEKVRRFIVVSNPFEALSYHQLFGKPSDLFTVYISLSSLKMDSQIDEIQYLIDLYKPENIIIATKTDSEGKFWTSSLLGNLFEPRAYDKTEKYFKETSSEIQFHLESLLDRSSNFNRLTVHLTYNDIEKGILMNENLWKYFSQINQKELLDNPDLEGESPFYFEDRVISRHESFAPIVFPNKIHYLELLIEVIRHLRPLLILKIEIPEFGSFENTLKNHLDEKMVYKEIKARKLG